jgi:hypothetical protein
MRRFVHVPVALLLLAVSASVVHAQSTELQPGARVRITAPGIVAGRYTGTLLSRSRDTLQFGSQNGAPVSIPMSRITSIEISRGRSHGSGALRGLAWGVPIGLVFGIATASSVDNCGDLGCDGLVTTARGVYVISSTLSGAFWGAGIGALIGRERWEPFALTRMSFGGSGGRSYARITIPF